MRRWAAMLAEFAIWWLRQLRALFSSPLPGSAGAADALLVRPGPAPGQTRLVLRRRGRETPLPDLAPGPIPAALPPRHRSPVVLCLPPEALLEREIVLPLAAERDPEAVLTHEMDRLTPFRAEDLVWNFVVTRRDPRHLRLHLRLSLVPRAVLAPLLVPLARAGLDPVMIEVGLPGAGLRRLEITGREPRRGSRRRARRYLAATPVLALAALATPFLRQSRHLAALDHRIAALRPAAAAAARLRARLVAGARGAAVLKAERARVGDALAALAALTRRLPGNTYLTDLTLRRRRLTLAGHSAAAAGLIARLAADPILRDPAFAAPVIRIGPGVDLFSIRAELAP